MPYDGVYKNRKLKKLPSVTTIIKNIGWSTQMLMAWQNRLWESGQDPRVVSKEACDIGTVTHELIEHWIFGEDDYEQDEGVDDSVVLEASEGLTEYIEWSEGNGVEYLESELRLVSEEYQFGGTADGIIRMNGKVYLIDFKTSKAVYDSHITQLAAYKHAVEETSKYKIDGCMVIRIAKGELKSGEKRIQPHILDNNAIVDGWEIFKMARKLHEIHKAINRYTRKINTGKE